ncbi:MAG: amino acid ABC transporter substrate-binding protein [Candidatus Aerophobetes bacterium]
MRSRIIPIILLTLFVLGTIVFGASCETKEPIVFGGALPLTGWGADGGEYNRRGYMVWEDMVNAAGGILGRPVKVIIYDDKSDPTVTTRLYEKLVTQDKVDFLLSPWTDDMVMAATTVGEKYGKTIVAGGATYPAIWERGYKYVTGLLPNSKDYLGVGIRFFSGLKTVALLNLDLTFTTGFADAAEWNFPREGMTLVLPRQTYTGDTTDLTAPLMKIKAKNPDFIVACTGGAEDATMILRQAKEIGLNPKAWWFTIAPVIPEYIEVLGEDAEYTLGCSEWEPELPDTIEDFSIRAAFNQRHREMFGGEDPVEDAATTFGVGQIMQLAIEKVGELDDEKINEALHELDTSTVFGYYRVDEAGKQKGKVMYVIQVQDGVRETLWPFKAATSVLRFPTPPWDKRD